MQNLIIPKPYEFVPPRFNPLICQAFSPLLPLMLRKAYGVASVKITGREHLNASLRAGHGILLTPNHSRPSDPFVIASLGNSCRRPVHIMSTWHVFMEGAIQRYLLQRVGIFSVHRESVDRASLRCAEQILHRAAHRRQREHRGQVVIHPVFIRYRFAGDVAARVSPVLDEVEQRLGWQPQRAVPLRQRVLKIGQALLASKEIEYLGAARSGSLTVRIAELRDAILQSTEEQWLRRYRHQDTMARVKAMRTRIFPHLLRPDLTPKRHEDLWRVIGDLYFAQQLHCYPEGYLNGPEPERLLEVVEHFEEDLTDKARPHYPLHAHVHVGEALLVPAEQRVYPHADPLMARLREQMEHLMVASRGHA